MHARIVGSSILYVENVWKIILMMMKIKAKNSHKFLAISTFTATLKYTTTMFPMMYDLKDFTNVAICSFFLLLIIFLSSRTTSFVLWCLTVSFMQITFRANSTTSPADNARSFEEQKA